MTLFVFVAVASFWTPRSTWNDLAEIYDLLLTDATLTFFFFLSQVINYRWSSILSAILAVPWLSFALLAYLLFNKVQYQYL